MIGVSVGIPALDQLVLVIVTEIDIQIVEPDFVPPLFCLPMILSGRGKSADGAS